MKIEDIEKRFNEHDDYTIQQYAMKLLAVAKAARKCDEEGWLDENEYGADHPLSLIAKALRELEQD